MVLTKNKITLLLFFQLGFFSGVNLLYSDYTDIDTISVCVVLLQAVNDEAPEIITEQLFVQEDKSVSMTNATFFVIDLDSRPDELLFTVDSPPSHGM